MSEISEAISSRSSPDCFHYSVHRSAPKRDDSRRWWQGRETSLQTRAFRKVDREILRFSFDHEVSNASQVISPEFYFVATTESRLRDRRVLSQFRPSFEIVMQINISGTGWICRLRSYVRSNDV